MGSLGTVIAAHLASGAAESAGGAIGGLFGKKGKKIGRSIGRALKFRRGGKVGRYAGGGKVRVPPHLHYAYGGTVSGKKRIIRQY